MKSPIRNWSLGRRLTLGILVLTAIAFIVTGALTQSLLRGYLTSEVDSQITAIAEGTLPRILESGIAHEADEHHGDDDHRNPVKRSPLARIPTSTSVTLIDPNGIVVAGLGGDFQGSSIKGYLTALSKEEMSQHGNTPFTLHVPGPDFRVVARQLPGNNGTVVAAQSLSDLNRTTTRLGVLFTLIGLALLLMIAFAARAVIKLGLRPLEEAEKTAEEIAAGNYSARMPEADPKTEVGRLVTSLNSMLTRIEGAFAVRKESEERLRRFVADASHELRTPITAIRGFSELHRQGAVTGEKETTELIGRIENESKRMGSLVEDLLLLARLDQAREMESKPVDLKKIAEEAVISAQAAGPNHPLTFTSNCEEIFTLGDESRIHQVIANLLSNARAHTPAGTPIEVAVSEREDAVEVSVSDRGPGLSEADQAKIFERFYRADTSRVRSGDEGSGLGLSIVDAVMRAHGGHVSVNSKLGEGATFTLTFPRKNA